MSADWGRVLYLTPRGRSPAGPARAQAPPSPLAQFLQMAVRPSRGVELAARFRPDLVHLALVLGIIGLMRGIVEGFWYYLMTGQLHKLPDLLARPEWYTRLGGA